MPITKYKKPIIDMPSKKQLEGIVRPYSDEELGSTQVDDRIKKLTEFFDEYGIDYGKFKPEHLSFIENKKAYPNYDQYIAIPGQHDMKKWLMTVKEIHYKKKAGYDFKDAVRQSTQDWKKMEIYDFLNWLRFHEEGAHMKYKTAQVWYENGQPGYFLHIKPDAKPEPEPVSDGNAVNDAREEAAHNEDKRNIIERQRSKIIGRLDSAEKLLRSPDGQQFAGKELESLMEAIYGLKKKVQLVNKLSVATRLYEDMIVREANVLSRNGFTKAASMLYSIAQTPGQSGQSAVGSPNGDGVPVASPPPDPSGAGQVGVPSGLPATAPGVPNVNTPVDGDQNKDQVPAVAIMNGGNVPTGTAQSTPAIMPQEDPQPKGIKEFIENMNEGNQTEESKAEDHLEVSDQEEELMVTEAQAIPPAALEDVPMTDSPSPVRGKPANLPSPVADTPDIAGRDETLEVTEDDIAPKPEGADKAVPVDSGFDAKLDNMLAGVTIDDIVRELEELSKIFKVREIPRRLSIIDMMLDSKGLSSFFSSLSEAQNKALDSNNYISTRVDDILSKLRGSMNTKSVDLTGGPERSAPDATGIKNKLQQDQDAEKQRKQRRKDEENAEITPVVRKETPNVDIGELGQPTQVAPPIQPKV
jgi:hypothetical protein